jgi:pimeloyl-ACP methyl ester carboxylesterase
MAPDAIRRVFAPCAVPVRFKRAYSLALAMRTSQMQAVEEEAAMLPDVANTFSPLYRELSVPVRLIAGSDDRIVDTTAHSVRLHQELTTSTFHRIPECGHMVHHAAPDDVTAAIAAVDQQEGKETGRRAGTRKIAPQRHWLHIGESLVAA